MKSIDIRREVNKGIILWYDMKEGSRALYDGKKEDPVFDALCERSLKVDLLEKQCAEGFGTGTYDYVISIASIEKDPDPIELLERYRSFLKKDGRLLLALNNRMGLRYFCGDRDPYTERSFDGIEDYQRAYRQKEDLFRGRCYDEAQIREMIAAAGFCNSCFFTVLSDLDESVMLFREDYLPKEDLATRVSSRYNSPDTVFLAEENLYSAIIKNGLFHKLANAYFVECYDAGKAKAVLQATLSLSRGPESSLVTLIGEDGIVEKRALYPESEAKLDHVCAHLEYMKKQGIKVVDCERRKRSLRMPYVDAPIAQTYLKELLKSDTETFLREMDHFRELILRSSEHVKEDTGDGVILKQGFIDMVPLNSFYQDGDFVFFDQEFCVEDYPANAIISRMVCTFYERNLECSKYYPMEKLLERYGLLEQRERWRRMDTLFFNDILDRDEVREDRRKHYPNYAAIDGNRLRLNYPAYEYQKRFVDIFEGLENKKLILFGSGRFAKRFEELYGPDYDIDLIIDNDRERWGKKIHDTEICSPQVLRERPADSYCVLICVKNYTSIVMQLEAMGVKDYRIYDATQNYPRKRKPVVHKAPQADEEPKKYHIGYVAGVFDLFHIGHLNLLKRAKEMCDYLIVGVVSDSGVKRDKNSESFIPMDERKEIVASCRYVDEVVEVPPTFSSIEETFKLYHYDVQFSGDDHAKEPSWLEAKAYLEKHGATIEFFPYTESTSSTKLKGLIEKRLL